MTRRTRLAVVASVALVATIAVTSTVLARRDHELVPAFRLGESITTVQVQRLADRLGIPGEVERTRGGWEASEGGVALTVQDRPGLPWRAGPVEKDGRSIAAPTPGEAVRVALEVVHDVGGPRVELVDVDGAHVVLRPIVSGSPISAMPWTFVVERGGRVVIADGWLNRPTPVLVTPEQLRDDDRLLPRRVPDDAVSVSGDAY